MKIALKIICLSLLVGFVSITNAGKYDSVQSGYLRQSNQLLNQGIVNLGTENSSVTIDFSIKIGESWDAVNDSNNLVAHCIKGDVLSGVAWSNVTISTIDDRSWLSEATLLLSDSNGNQGVELAIASFDRFSGIGTYSSEGVLDFTDSGISDIVALEDKNFPIQFFEEFDDITNAIEANFTSGTLTFWGLNLTTNPECEFATAATSDLRVSLSADNTADLSVSDTINFTVSIENIGATTASNVVVTDTLTGINFVDAACDDGSVSTYANRTVTTNVNDIDAGNTLTCTIQTRVAGFGAIEYTSSVLSDNDSSNNNNVASISFRGAAIIIPINNDLALFLLMLIIILFARKQVIKP